MGKFSLSEGTILAPWPWQTKVMKTGSSGFLPWRSGLWEKHYDWPASVRIMDWLSTGKTSPGNMDLWTVAVK